MKRLLIPFFAALSLAVPQAQSHPDDPRDAICIVELDFDKSHSGYCKVDFYNSGNIHIIFNDDTTWEFKVLDTRLNMYSLNGAKYLLYAPEYFEGVFTKMSDSTKRIRFKRFNHK